PTRARRSVARTCSSSRCYGSGWTAAARSSTQVPSSTTRRRSAATGSGSRSARSRRRPWATFSSSISPAWPIAAVPPIAPMAAQAPPRRLTEVNPELAELALGKLEPIHWRSFDGMEIWGLLLTPPGDGDARQRRRLPLVVYLHGGPIGGVTYGVFPQFMHSVGQVEPYPIQAMASAGLAVLLPMPRGGSGYGEAGFRMIENGWGEGDYQDVMAGVDDLVKEGVADPDRLGVMGASYGGYLTDWIVTQT